MKLYIKSKRKNVDAVCEYDKKNAKYTVLKGSVLSENVTSSSTFSGSSVLKARAGCVKDNVLLLNKEFSSSSIAANFVKGVSCNGLICWKDKSGKTLKSILAEENNDE